MRGECLPSLSIVRGRPPKSSIAQLHYTGKAMTQNRIPDPPVARKIHSETTLHGVVLTDDYAWLRDKAKPEVTAYLEAENAYGESVMAPLAGLRDELYQEMLSHVKQTDVSVPFRDGAWWYYTRTEEGLQYSIHCRKAASAEPAQSLGAPGLDFETGESFPPSAPSNPRLSAELVGDHAPQPELDSPEEVLLDGNVLAVGHAFFSIGDTDITDDGRWLAYTTDTTGFRQYTLHIKDLATGETLEGPGLSSQVERVGSVAWAADNQTLFYTVEDEEQKRQHQLWKHTRGTPHAADVLVFQDDDERFNLGTGRTRDGKYVVMESASHITSECWVLPAHEPNHAFTLITPREDEHEYSVDHRNGLWFIRTNDAGRNFRLVTAPVATPGRENWVERIPHRDAIMLEDVDLFQSFFVACEREDGLPRLRVWRFGGDGPEAAPSAEIA